MVEGEKRNAEKGQPLFWWFLTNPPAALTLVPNKLSALSHV